MSGYSEESAVRVRRVGGIAFLAWAWLGQLETVIVTGSFVPRTDMETPSPLTVISAEDIAQSGLTSTTDIVRTLTADNSGTLPTSFVGAAAGAAGVSLRGMTVNSTLVLIDGHRATNYPLADDGQRTFVDLNTMPLDVVDHIEVLKDGASGLRCGCHRGRRQHYLEEDVHRRANQRRGGHVQPW
jgi:outer membrane receptor for ferrienterochelin and colicin